MIIIRYLLLFNIYVVVICSFEACTHVFTSIHYITVNTIYLLSEMNCLNECVDYCTHTYAQMTYNILICTLTCTIHSKRLRV